jgi:hypothetical protein
MRILVNGYFYGGNCPPFVSYLKKFNKDTKVTNALGPLDDYGVNRDYLTDEDLVGIHTNPVEKLFIYVTRKMNLGIWKQILICKTRKVVREYNPDLVINHKAGVRAEIMLSTYFQPQITYIYGSEVHGPKIRAANLDFIFGQSRYLLTTTAHMKSFLIENRPDLTEKIRIRPWGHFEMHRVLKVKKMSDRQKLRQEYGFNPGAIIFFDNRSLRGEHTGLYQIINCVRRLNNTGENFKIIFLRGFLGTDAMIRKLQNAISEDERLKSHVILMDEIVPQDKLLKLYLLSDAFISLLPSDQFGTSILDAVLTDCSLILSDLEVYKEYLGESGPIYIKEQDENELMSGFQSVIENTSNGRVSERFYLDIINDFNPDNTFRNIYQLCTSLVDKGYETGFD